MKNLDNIIRQQNPSVVTIRNFNEFKDIDGNDVVVDMEKAQSEYDAQAYARKRAQEYPDLAEQLDLLWHAIDTDTLDNKDYRNKFYTMLKKVKEDNPKG